MNIFDRVRAAFATPEEPSGSLGGRSTKELGGTGLENFHGFISQDYNPKFHGQTAVRIYEEMRRGDATAAAVLKALKLPILATEWSIESADREDEKANEQAEFIRHNFVDLLEGGFHGFQRQSFTCLDFGFSYFEKVFAFRDGKIILKKLAPRLQTAHDKWTMESDPKTPGITQFLPTIANPDGPETSNPEIPMSKLVLFTNDKEGDNPEGISILRSAYKHWYFKDLFYRIDGIKHERGAGILVIGLPDGAGDKDVEDAENLGKNFKVNEQGYIVKPSAKWEVELLSAGISDQSTALMESIKHHDREITKNVLAQFIDLGSNATGSFALSTDQTNFFQLALTAIGQAFEEVVNEQIIKQLIILNFGVQEKYPKFRYAAIGDVDFDEMSTVMERLLNAGVVKNDPTLKVWIHKTFGLPEVTVDDFEDEEEEEEDKPEPPPEPPDPDKKEPDKPDGDDKDDEEEEEEEEDAELAERKFFRPLTEAEERVALAEVDDFFNQEEEELETFLRGASDVQKQALLKKSEKILNAGDIAAVAGIVAAIAPLKKEIAQVAKTSLEKGKATSAAEIGVAIPVTINLTRRILQSKVDLLLTQRQQALENSIKTRIIAAIDSGVSTKQALLDIETAITAELNRSNAQISGRIVVDSFNQGRAVTFDKNKADLHGLQRSEILDGKTCPMCMELDGRVFSVNDPFTSVGQIHTNCRGIWVAVKKTDTDLPPIKTLPKSIQNKFKTVGGVPILNNFKQPKKVTPRKESNLEKKVKQGDVILPQAQK